MSFMGAENATQILNIGLQKVCHWLSFKAGIFYFLSFTDHQHVSHGNADFCVLLNIGLVILSVVPHRPFIVMQGVLGYQ